MSLFGYGPLIAKAGKFIRFAALICLGGGRNNRVIARKMLDTRAILGHRGIIRTALAGISLRLKSRKLLERIEK
jgi:hypothetical protein